MVKIGIGSGRVGIVIIGDGMAKNKLIIKFILVNKEEN